MTAALRQAISNSELLFKALERETDLLRKSLMEFVRGETSLRLDIADTLAEYFELEIVNRKVR